MKTTMLFLALLLTFVSCEKEPETVLSNPSDLFGIWSMYHDVDGTASDVWVINDQSYSYDLTIHNDCRAEIEVSTNGYHYRTYKFYITIEENKVHISYDNWNHAVPPMLPAFGWHKYLHYKMNGQEVLLLGYQQWLR